MNKTTLSVKQVAEISDAFAEWFMDDWTLADFDDNNHRICSCSPNILRYKREIGSDLVSEFLGWLAKSEYADIVPYDSDVIMGIIRFFERCPLAGRKARLAWNERIKEFDEAGRLNVPVRFFKVDEESNERSENN